MTTEHTVIGRPMLMSDAVEDAVAANLQKAIARCNQIQIETAEKNAEIRRNFQKESNA